MPAMPLSGACSSAAASLDAMQETMALWMTGVNATEATAFPVVWNTARRLIFDFVRWSLMEIRLLLHRFYPILDL
jgi:hypothetical protein